MVLVREKLAELVEKNAKKDITKIKNNSFITEDLTTKEAELLRESLNDRLSVDLAAFRYVPLPEVLDSTEVKREKKRTKERLVEVSKDYEVIQIKR